MATQRETISEFSESRGQFWLWFGFLLPPVAWAIQLQTVYLLTEHGCATGNFMSNHLTSIFALLLAVIGGVVSWRNWLEAGAQWKSEKSDAAVRNRFMAILGMLTGALFLLVIFAQWLPTIVGVPCGK